MNDAAWPAVTDTFAGCRVTAGAGVHSAMYVNVAALDVPPLVVTVTTTAPAEPGGVVTVSDVVEAAVTVALFAPNVTMSPEAVALKPEPLMVTVVAPVVGPLVGLIVIGGKIGPYV